MKEAACSTTWIVCLARSGVRRPFLFAELLLIYLFLVRKDVCNMYFDGDFVLFPTYKKHMNAMAFSKLTGCFDRDEDDDSPRRPLTAVRNH